MGASHFFMPSSEHGALLVRSYLTMDESKTVGKHRVFIGNYTVVYFPVKLIIRYISTK